MRGILRNPWFMRGWRAWRRDARGRGVLRVLALLVVAMWLGDVPRVAAFVAAALGLVVLTAVVVRRAAASFPSEARAGTLQLSVLTCIPASREVAGRWGAVLLPAVEPWLIGAFMAVPLGTRGVGVWLLAALWLASWAALGLACSPGARSAGRATLWTLQAWWLSGSIVTVVALVFGCVDGLTMLPLSPLAFEGLLLVPAEALPAWIAAVTAAWTASLAVLLCMATLRVERFALTTLVAVEDEEARGGMWMPPVLLRGFGPYVTALDRFVRRSLRAGRLVGGSVVPPLLVTGALFTSALVVRDDFPEMAAHHLVAAVAVAAFWSLCTGFSAALNTWDARPSSATWPLMVVSGMRPSRLLSGRFWMIASLVSGEWAWTLPCWLLAAVWTGQPALMALALLQPMAQLLGVMAGMRWAVGRFAFAPGTAASLAAVLAVVFAGGLAFSVTGVGTVHAMQLLALPGMELSAMALGHVGLVVAVMVTALAMLWAATLEAMDAAMR